MKQKWTVQIRDFCNDPDRRFLKTVYFALSEPLTFITAYKGLQIFLFNLDW